MPKTQQTPRVDDLIAVNDGMLPAQAHAHLCAARLWRVLHVLIEAKVFYPGLLFGINADDQGNGQQQQPPAQQQQQQQQQPAQQLQGDTIVYLAPTLPPPGPEVLPPAPAPMESANGDAQASEPLFKIQEHTGGSAGGGYVISSSRERCPWIISNPLCCGQCR